MHEFTCLPIREIMKIAYAGLFPAATACLMGFQTALCWGKQMWIKTQTIKPEAKLRPGSQIIYVVRFPIRTEKVISEQLVSGVPGCFFQLDGTVVYHILPGRRQKWPVLLYMLHTLCVYFLFRKKHLIQDEDVDACGFFVVVFKLWVLLLLYQTLVSTL